MAVLTYIGNNEEQDGNAGIQVASGFIALGGHGNVTNAELEAAHLVGKRFLLGPSTSPGAPPAGMVAAAGASGALTGVYKYVVTFVTLTGETLASPEATVTLASQDGSLTAIPVGGVNSGVTARKIYRTAAGGGSGTEKLVAVIADNTTTTYTDSTADGSLGADDPATDTSSNFAAVATALSGFLWSHNKGERSLNG